jgi:hypothetical protein
MEGSCSTGQSPQWAVVPVEEEEEVIMVKSDIPPADAVSALPTLDVPSSIVFCTGLVI